MPDTYKITRKGRLCWELTIADWSGVFYTKRFRFKRSAERLVRLHSGYRALVRGLR